VGGKDQCEIACTGGSFAWGPTMGLQTSGYRKQGFYREAERTRAGLHGIHLSNVGLDSKKNPTKKKTGDAKSRGKLVIPSQKKKRRKGRKCKGEKNQPDRRHKKEGKSGNCNESPVGGGKKIRKEKLIWVGGMKRNKTI